MKVRFWKHNPPYSERFIEIEGFGFACLDRCSWSSRKLSTCDLHECDASWQPLAANKPLDPPLVKVREWVSDEWMWKENRWRQEGDGPLMYFNDAGVWMVSDWKKVEQSMTAHVYEVHPGTRIPIDQPLPSPPCDVVPANEAKPCNVQLDNFTSTAMTEWQERQEILRRLDKIEKRIGIKRTRQS